nr:RNA polymerase b'-subunit [Pedinophyceae sp. YPF-701]
MNQVSSIYFNRCFDKKTLKGLIHWALINKGEAFTIQLLEKLKTLGYQYATKAGISLSLDDLIIPQKKKEFLQEAENSIQQTQLKFDRGDITVVEQFQHLMDTWHLTSERLKQEVVSNFQSTDPLNSVYMMAFSGARGNLSQVRQLVGMRGLMSDPQGQIINFPIQSNFREGLTLTEYVISCYGARKGLVDTALRTANSGYLTRRLVDVAQHVLVSQLDCGTQANIALTEMVDSGKTILSLEDRLIGRVLAEDIPGLANRNTEITENLAAQLSASKTSVKVRSPLTCQAKNAVCRLCYGWSLTQGKMVSLGEAVGVLAAQSIGEPGTQLTMRTFHTGGVFSGESTEQVFCPETGYIVYPDTIPGVLIRTSHGRIAFFTKQKGSARIQDISNSTDKTSTSEIAFPPFSILFFRNKQKVLKYSVLAEYTAISKQSNQSTPEKHVLVAPCEGQVHFERAIIGVRKNTDGDITKLAVRFGSLWILTGSVIPLSLGDSYKWQQGDFLALHSPLNQSFFQSSYDGYLISLFEKPSRNSHLSSNAQPILFGQELNGGLLPKVRFQMGSYVAAFNTDSHEVTFSHGFKSTFKQNKTEKGQNSSTLLKVRPYAKESLEYYVEKVFFDNLFPSTSQNDLPFYVRKMQEYGIQVSLLQSPFFNFRLNSNNCWVKSNSQFFSIETKQGKKARIPCENAGFIKTWKVNSNYETQPELKSNVVVSRFTEMWPIQLTKDAFSRNFLQSQNLDVYQEVNSTVIVFDSPQILSRVLTVENNEQFYPTYHPLKLNNFFTEKDSKKTLWNKILNLEKTFSTWLGFTSCNLKSNTFLKCSALKLQNEKQNCFESYSLERVKELTFSNISSRYNRFRYSTSFLTIGLGFYNKHSFFANVKELNMFANNQKQAVFYERARRKFNFTLSDCVELCSFVTYANSNFETIVGKQFSSSSGLYSKLYLSKVFSALNVEKPRFPVSFVSYETPLFEQNKRAKKEGEVILNSIETSVQVKEDGRYETGNRQPLLLLTKENLKKFQCKVSENQTLNLRLGQLVRVGDLINLEEKSSNFQSFIQKGTNQVPQESLITTKANQKVISNGIPISGQVMQISKKDNNSYEVTVRLAKTVLFSSRGVFQVDQNDVVKTGASLLTLFYQRLQSGDIVQGIPKIEEFFEARHTKQGEYLPNNLHEQLQRSFLANQRIYPLEKAVRKSLQEVQSTICNGVQHVYQSQGVSISDKHLEIIVRQMTSIVRVSNGGSLGLLPGELVNLDSVELFNKGVDGQLAEYEPIILGITKASLETKSFISAASFQETTRILSQAAIGKKTDFLRGLKESVIVGHLIPAGTGFLNYPLISS